MSLWIRPAHRTRSAFALNNERQKYQVCEEVEVFYLAANGQELVVHTSLKLVELRHDVRLERRYGALDVGDEDRIVADD